MLAFQNFLDWYNLCIFAYGQTGSGRTYTMEGPQVNDIEMEDEQGIIPRAMKQVFDMTGDLIVCGWTVSSSFLYYYMKLKQVSFTLSMRSSHAFPVALYLLCPDFNISMKYIRTIYYFTHSFDI